MSYHAYSTPSTREQVARLLKDAERAVGAVRLYDRTLDPDEARATLESFLDTLSTWPGGAPSVCADCHTPLPMFRTHPWHDTASQVVVPLCSCCYAQREEHSPSR